MSNRTAAAGGSFWEALTAITAAATYHCHLGVLLPGEHLVGALALTGAEVLQAAMKQAGGR